MNSLLKLMLLSDFLLRIIGTICFTLFIAVIYQLTGKSADIGFISLATVAPSLWATLFAGKYASRYSPLFILRMVTFARIAIFVVASVLSSHPLAILLAAALQSLTHQVSIAAKMSLDAEILPSHLRRAYNSQKTMLANIAIVAGPPLGGVLASSVGAYLSLVTMALFSTIISIVLLFVKKYPALKAERHENPTHSALDSLRYLRSIPRVASVVSIYCLISVILEVQAPLLFPFVREIYNAESDFTGLLLGLAGLGGIAGAVIAQRFPRLFSEESIPWLVVTDGIIFFIFTQLRDPIIASVLFTTLGIMGAVTLIIVEGAVQKDVAPQHRPFVFSLMQFAGGAGGASLGIAAAFLADGFGTKLVLSTAALSEIAFGTFFLFGIHVLWQRFSTIKNRGA